MSLASNMAALLSLDSVIYPASAGPSEGQTGTRPAMGGQSVPFTRRGGGHRGPAGPPGGLLRPDGEQPFADRARPVFLRDGETARGPVGAHLALPGGHDPRPAPPHEPGHQLRFRHGGAVRAHSARMAGPGPRRHPPERGTTPVAGNL